MSLALTVVAGAMLMLLQYASAAVGDRRLLERSDVLYFAMFVLAVGAWHGYRHSHSFALAAVRFRKRWRRREWTELFGFAVGLSLFGVVLGLVCSVPKWIPPVAENAAQVTLIYVSMAAAAGFVGGLGAQFTPITRSKWR